MALIPKQVGFGGPQRAGIAVGAPTGVGFPSGGQNGIAIGAPTGVGFPQERGNPDRFKGRGIFPADNRPLNPNSARARFGLAGPSGPPDGFVPKALQQQVAQQPIAQQQAPSGTFRQPGQPSAGPMGPGTGIFPQQGLNPIPQQGIAVGEPKDRKSVV